MTGKRAAVTSRVLAGTLGAYLVTALMATAASILLIGLGVDPVETVAALLISSFVVLASISLAVFHAHNVKRAWFGLGLTAVPCGLVIAISMLTGGA